MRLACQALPYTGLIHSLSHLGAVLLRTLGRRLLWVYALLMLLAALGYARYDLYIMDGDGTAFLDIAQDLISDRHSLAINGYWNPGYPAVLAMVERAVHPSLWRELVMVRYANVLIFAFAMAACVAFTTALARARRLFSKPGRSPAVTDDALSMLGLGLLVFSMGRELPLAAPRSDTLLFAWLMLAASLLLRLLSDEAFWAYPALGAALGAAYLTKSFAFLPSAFLMFALLVFSLRRGMHRTRALGGVASAVLVFAAMAGPYIHAISRRYGHFTTGESARLNYAFFIDDTARWHEWHHQTLGHAGGVFLHPETVLASAPPVYSFAAHPFGTFPLWFDPAWWTLGLKPHLWWHGHLLRLARNAELLLRFMLGRPEIFVLLAVLWASGAAWPRPRDAGPRRALSWAVAPLAWGVLMLAIYFPIDLQDRYLTAPFFLIVLPLFALLQSRPAAPSTSAHGTAVESTARALVLLFAGISLLQAFTYLADARRHLSPVERSHPGWNGDVFAAAAGLRALGLQPGEAVACMGDLACENDHYWARVAGTQILAEVETPEGSDPQTTWAAMPNPRTVAEPLAHLGLRYVVAEFGNSTRKPEGWIQLGASRFFAYPLGRLVTPQTAAAVEALRPAP